MRCKALINSMLVHNYYTNRLLRQPTAMKFAVFSNKAWNKKKGILNEVLLRKDQVKPQRPYKVPPEYLEMQECRTTILNTDVKVVLTKNMMTVYINQGGKEQEPTLLNVILDHKCSTECQSDPPPKTFPKDFMQAGGVIIFRCEKCGKNEVLFDTEGWVMNSQGQYLKDVDNQLIGLLANIK